MLTDEAVVTVRIDLFDRARTAGRQNNSIRAFFSHFFRIDVNDKAKLTVALCDDCEGLLQTTPKEDPSYDKKYEIVKVCSMPLPSSEST